jgi:murein DD-endopeptidase MepM/ murein hydrolase activator NlpD
MADDKGDEPSFNPRTWAPSPPERAAAPQVAGLPDVRRGPGRRLVLGGAIGGGLALAAAGALILRPGPGPRPARKAAFADAATATLRRSLIVAGPGDIAEALAGVGLGADRAHEAARLALDGLGTAPGELRVSLQLVGPPTDLGRMEIRHLDGSGVQVAADAAGRLVATPLASDLASKVKVVRGEMDDNSFYSSAVSAGVTDSLISDFANAFAFDFDFQREIKPGDIFEAAFEQTVNGGGETVGADRLLYASLQTQAKSRALYRFKVPGEGAAAWFDGNGSSIVRSLMRTPVEGARITSSFGPRMHPVLGYTRIHKGTDFATPIGTTVYASGDGVVDFVGVHGGHGNYMRVRHSPSLETAYAHLSAYGAGMAVGVAVRQGQAIALSGNTGLSSGPHLHYEVIVNDEQVDPMTFQTTSGRALSGHDLDAFRKERDRIDSLRAAQNG